MGERKVVNKFYPSDFDPAKISRRKQPKNNQIRVRMMLPMTICCNTCQNYILKCSSEITFRTDPKNSDYFVEYGAKGLSEYWLRVEDSIKEAEEIGDSMKSLENRMLYSKREMNVRAALDEMKSLKSRQAKVSIDAMLVVLKRTELEKQKKEEEEDEALIRSVFKAKRERENITRIEDEDSDDGDGDGDGDGDVVVGYKRSKI